MLPLWLTFVLCETLNYFQQVLLEPTSLSHKVLPFSDTNTFYSEQCVAYKMLIERCDI